MLNKGNVTKLITLSLPLPPTRSRDFKLTLLKLCFLLREAATGQARRGYVTVYGRIFPWKWTWEMASIMRDVVDEKCKKCAIYQVQSACWNYPGGLTNDSALYCSVVASLHKSQIVCQDRDGGSWRHGEAGHRCLLLTTRDLNEIPREIWTHSVQTPVYHCVQ